MATAGMRAGGETGMGNRMGALFIDAARDGYHPTQVHTCTLEELIRQLGELADYYGEDMEVYLSHDGGYTYGGIGLSSITVGSYDERRVYEGEDA